jgi:NADH:ubiquinone oxidoreductase subunit D
MVSGTHRMRPAAVFSHASHAVVAIIGTMDLVFGEVDR